MEIRIKYHNPDLEKLQSISVGNWIDLRAAEDVIIFAGQDKLISLGVSMQLPEGYEAHIIPRSSTFKNFGVTQVNSMGVVDSTYAGENDIWKFWALAWRDTMINVNNRICQFRIMQVQPAINFVEVQSMDKSSRGGFGSTGINEFVISTGV
jgi:dUTP pyrophosphatase